MIPEPFLAEGKLRKLGMKITTACQSIMCTLFMNKTIYRMLCFESFGKNHAACNHFTYKDVKRFQNV